MYTLLGQRFAGWPGALMALGVGAFVPATIAVILGAAYVEYCDNPIARQAMQGARAGALAVFAWAVVRLLRPQLQQHRGRGIALALTTLAMTVVLPIPPFVTLLVAGARRGGVPPGGIVNAVVLYFVLLRAMALSFSGFASVPLIREDLVVQRAVLTDEALNSAIAISQASPGPLGLYLVVVGYFVAGCLVRWLLRWPSQHLRSSRSRSRAPSAVIATHKYVGRPLPS
jgi:chromate transport protein ChrA